MFNINGKLLIIQNRNYTKGEVTFIANQKSVIKLIDDPNPHHPLFTIF